MQSKANGPECALGYIYESEGRWICRLGENNMLDLIPSHHEIFVALPVNDLKNQGYVENKLSNPFVMLARSVPWYHKILSAAVAEACPGPTPLL